MFINIWDMKILYINCIFIIIIKVWCVFFFKEIALQCTQNIYVRVFCAVHSISLIRKKLNTTFFLSLEETRAAIPFSTAPSKRCYETGGTALELPSAMATEVRSTLKISLS